MNQAPKVGSIWHAAHEFILGGHLCEVIAYDPDAPVEHPGTRRVVEVKVFCKMEDRSNGPFSYDSFPTLEDFLYRCHPL